MSARFTAAIYGESFNVEIFGNGVLTILYHDEEQLEYDLAFAAMGGDKTAAVRLLDSWRDDPSGTICSNFELSSDTIASLAADWAEHVLPIFEKDDPGDERPRRAIKATRDFIDGNIGRDVLGRAEWGAWAASWQAKAAASWAAQHVAEASAWAAEAAAAAESLWPGGWAAQTIWAATSARSAAVDTAWEQSWQVRHFVHVMERLQAGKPWPKTEETS